MKINPYFKYIISVIKSDANNINYFYGGKMTFSYELLSAFSIIFFQTLIIIFLLVSKRKLGSAKTYEIKELEQLISEKNNQIKFLEKDMESQKIIFEEKFNFFSESREILKNEFEVLAGSILEAKQKSLTIQSSENLRSFLEPFREQVKNFEKKIEENYLSQSKDSVSLKEQIKYLKDLNIEISKDAKNLTDALKGSYKTQGTWGEVILENVLEKSGLQKGIDYKREESFTENHTRKRPDVIVCLPGSRHIIIDSKVSINSYVKYIEAENEDDRKIFMKEHVKAVKNHIETLAGKNYQDISSLNSPDMIFMFIPVEHAFLEAFKNNPGLLEYAFENKIAVVTPSTLMGVLKIVAGLWKIETQNSNAKNLFEHGKKVSDKLNVFIKYLDEIGENIIRLNETYEKTRKNLDLGRGNLRDMADDFKKFGV